VDFPNQRKIHKKVTPQAGGVAIFIGFALGLLYLQPEHEHLMEITLGACTIILIGLLDDRFDIRPIIKLSGQIIAATFLISSGLIIERITLPFIGLFDLGPLSVLITILWVVGITNAINLIDRKSTRLNSSHVSISYAVFCLEKKISDSVVLDDLSVEVVCAITVV